jgi:CheY-like chemotaxis protein
MKKKVIIVEDDIIFQVITKRMVMKMGLDDQPSIFANGLEALNFLERERPDPKASLIFLDINMPVMSGWEFLDEISVREEFSTYPVIMATSSINDSDTEKAKEYAQIIAYLNKPLNQDELQSLVDSFN